MLAFLATKDMQCSAVNVVLVGKTPKNNFMHFEISTPGII